MTGWNDLGRELDLWAEAGRVATLWWRDDDAIGDTPALRRLFDTAKAPLALAVIPETAGRDLAAAVLDRPQVSVLQHGYRHRNNAVPGAKKSEFPDDRPIDAIADDLHRGQMRMSEAFRGRFLPVLTPPWNRIGAKAVEILERLGFLGLSTYLPRPAPRRHGLAIVNTHVDVIDWQGGKRFLGEGAALGLLIGHLQARRTGSADAEEPTGLLTHHLVHDADTWLFLENLQDFLRDRSGHGLKTGGGVKFIEAAEAFGIRPGPR